MSAGRHLGVLVHLARERADFLVRELVDAVAEEGFVFGQPREGRAWKGWIWLMDILGN